MIEPGGAGFSALFGEHPFASQLSIWFWPSPVCVLLKIPKDVSATGTENAAETCSTLD